MLSPGPAADLQAQLHSLWQTAEQRRRLTDWYLDQTIDTAQLAHIGGFLIRHWSRRRPWRETLLVKLANSPRPEAANILWDWLQLKLERQEVRLKVARHLVPQRPQEILGWLVAHAHWAETGHVLALYPPAQILLAVQSHWMWKPFEPRVVNALSQSIDQPGLESWFYQILDTGQAPLPVQAWAMRALCQLQASCVPAEYERWLHADFTPVPLAAIAGLQHYPLTVQRDCLEQILRFRSHSEHGYIYNDCYWSPALLRAHELKLGLELQSALLELLPEIQRGLLGIDKRRWTLRLISLLLLQTPNPSVAATQIAAIEKALARKSNLDDALLVLQSLNAVWPDWPLPRQRVLSWIAEEVEYAWQTPEPWQNPQPPNLSSTQRWIIVELLQACRHHDWPELQPGLLKVLARLQPLRPRSDLDTARDADMEHYHTVREVILYFRDRGSPNSLAELLQYTAWEGMLAYTAPQPDLLQNLLLYNGLYENIVYAAARRGDASTLKHMERLSVQGEALQIPESLPRLWQVLQGALATLRYRLEHGP